MADTRILDAGQAERTVRRLAFEVVERNRGCDNIVLLGIRDRGALLATRLLSELEKIEGHPIPTYSIDVTACRDDRADAPAEDPVEPIEEEPDLSDRDVILVDDVLFTGRTVRAALDAVIRYGRPRTIQLAVLVDRGHREYPIRADYVGKVIPTKHRERVMVDLDSSTALSVDIVD
jgi:pyrimidine operon attenuation protein/uracil phosphoribosyltransferase